MARTGQEQLLHNYYKKLSGYLLEQYKHLDPETSWNKEQVIEFCRFRDMYCLMICSSEAIGDFEGAKELDEAYKKVVGISCKNEVERQFPSKAIELFNPEAPCA